MNAATATPRPLLRGWSHAIAIAPAVIGATALVIATRGDPLRQVSLAVYGIAITLLFTVSAMYHLGRWSPRARATWRRVDHAMIFVAIAGTYTPVVVNVLQGGPAVALLVIIWVLAGCGILVAGCDLPVPRAVLVGLYIAVGWTAAGFLPALLARVDAAGLAVLAVGGALYSIGGVIYGLQRPRLWPRVFGYHELFHLLVIAASALYFAFIAVRVAAAPS